jgi:hypothetical protein
MTTWLRTLGVTVRVGAVGFEQAPSAAVTTSMTTSVGRVMRCNIDVSGVGKAKGSPTIDLAAVRHNAEMRSFDANFVRLRIYFRRGLCAW